MEGGIGVGGCWRCAPYTQTHSRTHTHMKALAPHSVFSTVSFCRPSLSLFLSLSFFRASVFFFFFVLSLPVSNLTFSFSFLSLSLYLSLSLSLSLSERVYNLCVF